MEKWKVSYKDLEALRTHRPFYNRVDYVMAQSRKEAIEIVKNNNYYGSYGNYKASKS